MLTKKLACPSCGVGLRVSGETVAGKRIRCPKCGDTFAVSAGNGPPARPRPKAPPVEDDENPFELVEERPEPSRKRRLKKKAKSNTPLIVGVSLAGATLVIGAIILAVIYWPSGKKTESVAGNTPARSAAVPGGGGSDQSAAGRRVFDMLCTRCHAIGGSASADAGGRRGRNRGPDLAGVGRDPTHTVEWLMAFIRDPSSRKPDASMPAFDQGRLNDSDLRALAEYLASLK
jgi:mono/diheme cytochrome c family protein